MPDESTVPEDESMESRIRPATEEELPEPIVMEPEDEDFEPTGRRGGCRGGSRQTRGQAIGAVEPRWQTHRLQAPPERHRQWRHSMPHIPLQDSIGVIGQHGGAHQRLAGRRRDRGQGRRSCPGRDGRQEPQAQPNGGCLVLRARERGREPDALARDGGRH